MTVRSDAPFYWPLRGSIALQNGSGTPTFTRSTAKWMFNDEDKLIRLPSGAIEMRGYRPVINNLLSSIDFSGWTSVAFGSGSVVGRTANYAEAPDGSMTAYRLQLSLGGGVLITDIARIWKSSGVIPGNSATTSIQLKTNDGSTVTIGLWFGSSVTIVTVGPTWSRKYHVGASITDPTCYIGIRGGQSPACSNSVDLLLAEVQVEDSTGVADKTPSEFISKGALTAPYHGAGADGVKYFSTYKDGTPIPEANLLGARLNPVAITNNLLWCRDLTNAAWVKTNVTAALNQTGIDGQANASSLLTATAADATALQSITAASAAGCSGYFVRRAAGTGGIYFTRDGGTNWTDITSLINSSTPTLVKIENTSVTNPQVGFKIATSGDQIHVDAGINHLGTELANPILTTSATVTVNAETLTAPTASNFSDTAGTILATVTRDTWATGNGSAVGSATRGLYTNSANSGAQGLDGTNAVNGPSGTPSGTMRIGIRWSGSSMQAFSEGAFGSVGSYDGAFNLGAAMQLLAGVRGGVNDVAIWLNSLSDAEMISAAENINYGTLAALDSGSDSLSGAGSVVISGSLAASESVNDTLLGAGFVVISGSLAALESESDSFAGKSISDELTINLELAHQTVEMSYIIQNINLSK